MSKKNKKKKTKIDIILNVLLAVFILTFLASGAYLGIYFYNIHKSQKNFEEVEGLVDENYTGDDVVMLEATVTDADAKKIPMVEVDGKMVQAKYKNIYKKNHDFVGWIKIPGTKIDYPIVQTPDDEEYYIHRDFQKEDSSSGCIFLAARSDIKKPSDNILVYGHNMKAGTMFADLTKYEDQEFATRHNWITFNTIYGDGTYEVIAAFRTTVKLKEDTFLYYDFFNAKDEKEFDDYVKKVKELTPYKIDATAKYGDKLITLSTCAYHTDEGRYVVVAKKIR